MSRLDLYRRHAREYVAPREPTLVSVGRAKYLSIAGRGPAGGPLFQQQVGALYGVAFTIKMASKFAGRDYAVNKLEGLWWSGPRKSSARTSAGKKAGSAARPKAKSAAPVWSWKLLLRVPEFIGVRELAAARATLAQRGKDPTFKKVKLESLVEGPCVQVLHVGSYHEEQPTIDRMHAFAKAQGLREHGRHHEVYLSDPRRVPTARLKTILRQPVG